MKAFPRGVDRSALILAACTAERATLSAEFSAEGGLPQPRQSAHRNIIAPGQLHQKIGTISMGQISRKPT
ncbi:MAG: hypothetical protein RMI91_05075 [Gemmatales bacterium]|nr:hypothetical protein [Gemmatales bacterium]